MPIAKTISKPNGATLSFHKVTSASIDYVQGTCTAQVASWPTAAAYDSGAQLDWTQPVSIPLARALDAEAALIELADSPFSGGVLAADAADSLQQAKDRKNAEIDAERERRGALPVDYAGTQFDADATALRNVTGWQLQIARGMAIPSGFMWRDFNNVDHPCDAAFLDGLGAAITLRGTGLYQQAWTLKASVDAATTVPDVEAISWPAT